MKQLRDNLLLQFVVVSIVAFVVLGIILGLFVSRRLNTFVLDETVRDARQVAQGPLTSNVSVSDFTGPMDSERYAAFDEFVRKYVVSESTARIKLWNSAGTVVYSSDPTQVGQNYPIEDELGEALRGGVSAEISKPARAEHETERSLGRLVEVYVPVRMPGTPGVVGAFEVYQYYAPVGVAIGDVTRFALVAIALVFLALFLSLVAIVLRGWRRIQTSQTLLNNRVRELQGLNNLFQTYLNQNFEAKAHVDVFGKRFAEVPAVCRNHLRLLQEVTALADEFSSSTPGGPLKVQR